MKPIKIKDGSIDKFQDKIKQMITSDIELLVVNSILAISFLIGIFLIITR